MALALDLARRFWPVLLVLVGMYALSEWHKGAVDDARDAGRQEQAEVDAVAFKEAQRIAEADQAAIVAAVGAQAKAITERKARDSKTDDAAIDRLVAAKLREKVAREANPGGASEGAATPVPDAAGRDPEAYCAQTGWIPFGRALKMATDAERDASQARQCAAWVTEQQTAWPEQ
jgi:hypothetical protein